MITLTKENFDDTIAAGKAFVIFGAAWCGYCRLMEPIVEELEAGYKGDARLGKVDVDAEKDLSARYDITTLPTCVLFENGAETDRKIGAQTLEALESMIGD